MLFFWAIGVDFLLITLFQYRNKRMEHNLQEKLLSLRDCYSQFLTYQQKSFIKKSLTHLKDPLKFSKKIPSLGEDHSQQENEFFHSQAEHVLSLEKKVKNTAKTIMSDYQSFRWTLKKEGHHHKLPELFSMLKIPDQLRRLSIDKHQAQFFNTKTLTYSVQQLCFLTSTVLQQNQQCKQLLKPKQTLRLIKYISEEYHVNSYHNFTHAVSVMLLFRQIENTAKLSKYFTNLQLFLAEVAALAHDMGHKGLNSQWEIKKQSPLAYLYQNQSILQKMHVSRFFKLLREHPELDFFHNIKDENLRLTSKQLVTDLILATDMAKHFSSLQTIGNQLKNGTAALLGDKKQMTLQLIFHGCDIGNPCMQFQEYMNWSILLSYEFNSQALKQQKQGLIISQGFKFSSVEQFYKGQISFIDHFCFPVWKHISVILPQTSTFIVRINQNSEKISKKLKQLSAKK